MFYGRILWKFLAVGFIWSGVVKAQLSNEIDEPSYYGFGHPTSAGLSAHHSVNYPLESHQTKDDKRGGLVLDILHGLLSKYDNRIRPFAPDAELFVKVSFGGIEVIDVLESKEEVNSIVLLQQTWTDPRLVFEENEDEDSSEIEYITIAHEHTREIWIPDTFFVNEKKSQVHDGATGNDAITVYRNGTVSRSVRVAVNTHCQFNYKDFPFDAQTCSLEIGSHAYRASDVMYGWEEEFIGDVIGVENLSHFTSKIRTGKFAITGMNLNESTLVFNKGNMSRLTFYLTLQRAWKPFVTRYFLPCVLFVFVSLGTMFFADYRIALLVNLFNVAFLNIFVVLRSTSPDLPTISTSTAYDTYFILCLFYITVVLLITVYNLINTQRVIAANPNHHIQQPSSSSRHPQSFPPETVVLRHNRRRNNDQDIFSPNEDIVDGYSRDENGGNGSIHNGTDNDYEIYRTTSYPLRVSGRWKWIWRKLTKFAQWIWKHLRWILIVSFLLTDLIFFKIHSVQYA